MNKRSFFFKNYLAHFFLIVAAFGVVAIASYHQMSEYAFATKRTDLQSTADGLAKQTASLFDSNFSLAQEIYLLNLSSRATEDQIVIEITDSNGNVALRATPDGKVYASPGDVISSSIVDVINQDGSYAAAGNTVLSENAKNYFVGVGVYGSNGEMINIVLVTAEDAVVNSVIRQSMQYTLLIMLFTLIGALFISFIISRYMTRPLKSIADAAKEFAGGNFDVRVSEYNTCYEIDELASVFNNMAHDLNQLEELTRGFISNVSHEFKTPMTSIGGFVDGMIDGTIPPEQHDKYLHIIAEETKRLSRMVTRMLDAAKIQSGELLLSVAPFDFSEMTTQIILSFEKQIDQKRLDVTLDVTERLIVLGDYDHVFRAVYNLVDNAVKFINLEGTLTLVAKKEGGFCVFSITNSGTVISPEDLPHIFDRFYKTDRSRSMDKSGSGLGLYIVKNIINLHGGEISVRSDEDGTEFEFTLPLASEKV